MLNSNSFRKTLATLSCFVTTAVLAGPQFLTLPFSDPNVFVRQGWVYDSAGDFSCSDFPAGYENYCHKGIDYFLKDSDGKAISFDVLAAAPGKAVATYTKSGYGYFIFIVHNETDEFGRPIFTLYAHVKENSWTVNYRTLDQVRKDIEKKDFSNWQEVKRGEKIATSGNTGGYPQIHLHFEVQLNGYAVNKADPYDIYGTKNYYPGACTPSPIFPPETTSQFPSSFWTECPPVFASTEIVIYADPKDIWTTSVYSYAQCSITYPGGGLNDEKLRVGGWGDSYYSLLQFDLTGQPANVQSAVLYLYCFNQSGGGTPMYLYRVTQFWDWRIQGNGCDRLRLWWADQPTATPWISGQIPNATIGQWYAADITGLYNAWQSGTPNYGLELRPVLNFNNNFNEFYSSDSPNSALHPKLVIKP